MKKHQRFARFRPIFILTFLSASPIIASAQTVARSPGSWSPGFAQAPVQIVASLKTFIQSESGVALSKMIPSLGFLSVLTPDNEAHRSLVGAMRLSPELQAKLGLAAQTGGKADFSAMAPAIADAYRSSNAETTIAVAVTARAAHLKASRESGFENPEVFSEASIEMAPFSSIPAVRPDIQFVEESASSMRRKAAAMLAEAKRAADVFASQRASGW